MVIEKVIHGYEVTLDTDVDGAGDQSPDRVSGCWINKGDFSGSLELAFTIAGLEDSEGDFMMVSKHTLETIEKWALAHGY